MPVSLNKNISHYQAYLLRIWRRGRSAAIAQKETITWQASLEDPHTGKRLNFKDMDSLFMYLAKQTSVDEPIPGSNPQENQ
jgi:hypothetical protein